MSDKDARVRDCQNPVYLECRQIYCLKGAEFARPTLEKAWKEIERLEKLLESQRTQAPSERWWIVRMSLAKCDKAFPSLEKALEFQKSSPSALARIPVEVAEMAAGTQEPSEQSIRTALMTHWLSQIECNHYEKNDSAICACGWKSDRGFNVGKAVEFWIDHVFVASLSLQGRNQNG